MFEAPGHKEISRVVIDADVVNGIVRPRIYGKDNVLYEWNGDGTVHVAA
jgi:hypothetical protein